MPALSVLVLLFVADGLSLRPGDHARSLEVDEERRGYLVHVPPQYDPATPTPVVLAFHGGGGEADAMAAFSGLNEKADQAGFIVAYPDGSGRLERMRTFNAGNCCGHAAAANIDDVAFTRQILDDLQGIANVDRRRIFATGMSNGAMMAYRLAAELSDRIAAIAPIAGPMGMQGCRPGRAVSVIHFHGDADGKNGSEVVLVVIEGGGHTWPGRQPRIQALGASTHDIEANDLMWEFFEKHPMPAMP